MTGTYSNQLSQLKTIEGFFKHFTSSPDFQINEKKRVGKSIKKQRLSHPDIRRLEESYGAAAQRESNQNILSLNIESGFKEASCKLDKFPVIYFQVLIVLEEPPY